MNITNQKESAAHFRSQSILMAPPDKVHCGSRRLRSEGREKMQKESLTPAHLRYHLAHYG